jgi:hypothetical protein
LVFQIEIQSSILRKRERGKEKEFAGREALGRERNIRAGLTGLIEQHTCISHRLANGLHFQILKTTSHTSFHTAWRSLPAIQILTGMKKEKKK